MNFVMRMYFIAFLWRASVMRVYFTSYFRKVRINTNTAQKLEHKLKKVQTKVTHVFAHLSSSLLIQSGVDLGMRPRELPQR